jgi:hypothetical protein
MTLQNIEKYQDKVITDAGKEFNLDLTDEEKKEKEQKNEDSEALRKWLKDVLG